MTSTIRIPRVHSSMAIAAIVVSLAGCAATSQTAARAGAPSRPEVQVNRPDAIAAIATAASAQAVAPTIAAIALTPMPPAHGMSVFSLPDGHKLWETQLAIDARPWITGDLVIAHARGEVIAWDLRSGRERWRHPDYGLSLIGAAADGHSVAVSLGSGGLENRDGVEVIIDQASGSTRFAETNERRALGVPAMAGGHAFFPSDGQNLSIIEAAHGWEVARISDCEDFVSRVLHEGNAVYFGGARLTRFAREAATGRRAPAATYGLPRDDLPGRPHTLTSGYYAPYAGLNVRERTGVVLRPDPAQPGVRLIDDTVYYLFHRLVFAFDATTGAPRWAHVHNSDINGAEPVRGALLVADERGVLSWLDAHAGNIAARLQLGNPAVQSVIHVPLELAGAHAGEEPIQTAAATLGAAAAVNDERLNAGRLLAVRLLASLRGTEATRALVTVTSTSSIPDEVRTAAGEALTTRTDGTRAMIETLATHFDYYRRTAPPRIGFVARALANAHDRRAVAPLVSHLQDPYTPAAELPVLITALRDLGDPAALPALMDFLTIYHADHGLVRAAPDSAPVDDLPAADREALRTALGVAAEAAANIGGAPMRARLRALQDDRATVPEVRVAIVRALAPAPRVPRPAPAAATVAAAAPAAVVAPVAAPAAPAEILPPRLTPPMIQRGFAGVRARLLRCLPRNGAGLAAPVRVLFRYDGNGTVLDAVVTPNTFQACIAPIAAGLHFPRTAIHRETRVYLLGAGH